MRMDLIDALLASSVNLFLLFVPDCFRQHKKYYDAGLILLILQSKRESGGVFVLIPCERNKRSSFCFVIRMHVSHINNRRAFKKSLMIRHSVLVQHNNNDFSCVQIFLKQ